MDDPVSFDRSMLRNVVVEDCIAHENVRSGKQIVPARRFRRSRWKCTFRTDGDENGEPRSLLTRNEAHESWGYIQSTVPLFLSGKKGIRSKRGVGQTFRTSNVGRRLVRWPRPWRRLACVARKRRMRRTVKPFVRSALPREVARTRKEREKTVHTSGRYTRTTRHR